MVRRLVLKASSPREDSSWELTPRGGGLEPKHAMLHPWELTTGDAAEPKQVILHPAAPSQRKRDPSASGEFSSRTNDREARDPDSDCRITNSRSPSPSRPDPPIKKQDDPPAFGRPETAIVEYASTDAHDGRGQQVERSLSHASEKEKKRMHRLSVMRKAATSLAQSISPLNSPRGDQGEVNEVTLKPTLSTRAHQERQEDQEIDNTLDGRSNAKKANVAAAIPSPKYHSNLTETAVAVTVPSPKRQVKAKINETAVTVDVSSPLRRSGIKDGAVAVAVAVASLNHKSDTKEAALAVASPKWRRRTFNSKISGEASPSQSPRWPRNSTRAHSASPRATSGRKVVVATVAPQSSPRFLRPTNVKMTESNDNAKPNTRARSTHRLTHSEGDVKHEKRQEEVAVSSPRPLGLPSPAKVTEKFWSEKQATTPPREHKHPGERKSLTVQLERITREDDPSVHAHSEERQSLGVLLEPEERELSEINDIQPAMSKSKVQIEANLDEASPRHGVSSPVHFVEAIARGARIVQIDAAFEVPLNAPSDETNDAARDQRKGNIEAIVSFTSEYTFETTDSAKLEVERLKQELALFSFNDLKGSVIPASASPANRGGWWNDPGTPATNVNDILQIASYGSNNGQFMECLDFQGAPSYDSAYTQEDSLVEMDQTDHAAMRIMSDITSYSMSEGDSMSSFSSEDSESMNPSEEALHTSSFVTTFTRDDGIDQPAQSSDDDDDDDSSDYSSTYSASTREPPGLFNLLGWLQG